MMAYPDEILMSVLARYHHLNGHKGLRPTLRKVYGVGHKKTSADLPTTIHSILSQNILQSSFDKVILNNTLFPLYRPFLSKMQCDHILKQMMEGNGGTVHQTSGIMASVVKVCESLRLCPSCITQDIQIYGEPYWHRDHQLPGNLVCQIHKCELLTRCLICKKSVSAANLKEMPICPAFCENGHDLSVQIIKNDDGGIHRVSKVIVALFNACQNGSVPSNLRELYVSRLVQLNLCTVNKRIKQQELCSQFLSTFTADTLVKIGVPKPVGANNWLSTMLRKPRRSFHPLLHGLVMDFLWGGPPELFSGIKTTPFGNGPWPCLNKTASHYREFTINELKITRCSDTKKPVASFKCELCGFHYSRRGPDLTTEDAFRYGRVKDFGHLWKEKADLLIKNGQSIRSIAKSLSVDSSTVKLYLKKRQEKEDIDMSRNSERDIRRERFLQIINNLHNKNLSIRKANTKDYSWLYRNDREWLLSIMSRLPKQSRRKPRVNWKRRDKEIAQEINKAILMLKTKEQKPERLTLSRIGRNIGKLSLLEKRLEKLPICSGILRINLETEEQHQIRKIDWALKRIKQEGLRPVKWRVLRKAGIRLIKSENVEEYLLMKLKEAIHPLQESAAA